MINKGKIYYNPKDIVIAKYKMYLSSGFDLFVMHNFWLNIIIVMN